MCVLYRELYILKTKFNLFSLGRVDLRIVKFFTTTQT